MDKREKPILLIIVSIFLILAALSGMGSRYTIINSDQVGSKTFQAYLNSWSLLDKIIPFVLNPLLILSSFFMLKRKAISIKLFLVYLILTLLGTTVHIISSKWYEYYGMKGIAATVGSLSVMIAVYLYLRSLKKKGILVE